MPIAAGGISLTSIGKTRIAIMNLQIGQGPSPTFAQPLALMSDCHRRVEYFLNLLERIGQSAPDAALTPAEREALATALRYFREAAPRHTADEESSLFPRLRRTSHSLAAAVLARVEALEADHAAAAADHQIVEERGSAWLEAGRLDAQRQQEFRDAVARLQARYRPHIAMEDTEVFPLAASILSTEELRDVGVEMARRRNVPFTPVAPG